MSNELYIELLKKVLTDYHRMEGGEYKPLVDLPAPGWKYNVLRVFDKYLRKKQYAVCHSITYNQADRLVGKDMPSYADTMIGLARLENINFCFQEIIRNNIPGDFIEAGVWRGGSTIFMKALLKASNINDRVVWVADSFEGLPKPDEKQFPVDRGDIHHTLTDLSISLEVVKNNFRKYDLLDENVKFLKGWFKDTLPSAPFQKLAMLRLDGDMYQSTMETLENLYPKLSLGGFIIIDDWGALQGCKQAVNDYRQMHNITEEIKTIDWTGVYWRKEKD